MYTGMRGLGEFSPTTPGCGTTKDDVRFTQAALNRLGFTDASNRTLVVDGVFGASTAAAMGKYSVARGFGFIGATQAGGNICKQLWDEYKALQGAPATDCPAGMQRIAGACVPVPQVPGVTPPGPAGCPEGSYSVAGQCVKLPGEILPGLPKKAPQVEPPPSGRKAVSETKGLTRNAKIALGVGGVAVVGLIAALLLVGGKKAPSSYRENFRAATPKRRSTKRRRGHRSKHVIDVKVGRKTRSYGHATPPKKYRRFGATKAKHYADPEHFKYPIKTYKQVRAALAYFPRFKDRYPVKTRKTIARRLEAARRKFGIGGSPVRANRR